jgi:hypothetical protein
MAVSPPTNPGEAFGAGDPRNAKYFSVLAALEHQKENAVGSFKGQPGETYGGSLGEQRDQARAQAQYGQGLLTQREPLSYKANQHRANAGGIAESGVNAERRGTIGADYANKRFQITSGLQNTEGRLQRAAEGAVTGYNDQSANLANNTLGEGYNWLLEHQPNGLGPANVGGVKTITGPPEAGGVVPYTEKTPGGSVAVGSATRYAREMAAKRALEEKRK